MKKKIKYLLTMLVVVFAMVTVCGCGDDNDDASRGTSILDEYVEKRNHAGDMARLDAVNTAIKTYVPDPDSHYSAGKVYTLTEMIELDDNDIIEPIVAEVFRFKGDLGTFQAKSKAFKGITTDDVLIRIDKSGMVSIYVESQEEDYGDYMAGNVEELVQYR